MYCVRCGGRLEASQKFCPFCGTPVGAAGPAAPAATTTPVRAPGRIAGHVRVLGVLWLVLSLFRLLPSLLFVPVFHHGFGFGWFPFSSHVPLFAYGLFRIVRLLFFLGAALGVAAGWGLLARQPWARILAIILGFISLIEIPFGTALGIYTLWVLLPAESEREYAQLAGRA